MTDDIESIVRALVAENLGVPEDWVHREAWFAQDLGADSLDVMEIIIDVEDEFDIDIPDEELFGGKLLYVGELVEEKVG